MQKTKQRKYSSSVSSDDCAPATMKHKSSQILDREPYIPRTGQTSGDALYVAFRRRPVRISTRTPATQLLFYFSQSLPGKCRDTPQSVCRWAGRPGFDSWQGKVFLLSTSFRPALGPTQPQIQRVSGAFFLGVKRQGREADY
jgi:hypothetical protein